MPGKGPGRKYHIINTRSPDRNVNSQIITQRAMDRSQLPVRHSTMDCPLTNVHNGAIGKNSLHRNNDRTTSERIHPKKSHDSHSNPVSEIYRKG